MLTCLAGMQQPESDWFDHAIEQEETENLSFNEEPPREPTNSPQVSLDSPSSSSDTSSSERGVIYRCSSDPPV